MANRALIKEWEEAAKNAAASLFDSLESKMDSLADLTLEVVAPADRNGTNSIDSDFMDRLDRGEHLTDRFLANV